MTKETRLEATNTFPAKGEERTEAQLELAATLSCIARGDNAAFERLYRTTSAKLYSVISHIVRNDAAAEEVLQDVYFTIWSKSQLYDSSIASPMTWLITVARNKAIDRLRRDGTHIETEIERVAGILRDPEPMAIDQLARKQQRSHLNRCLEELDVRQREAIRAAFFGGFTYDELAKKASVPLPTLKSWIRRGLLRLKDCLDHD